MLNQLKKSFHAKIDSIQNSILKLNTIADENFEKIINEIENLKGLVFIIGLGKSGHIGKKIAATFCSVGIRSFFIHATEALHGDLGNITTKDCVIFLSFSGETKEVIDVCDYLNTKTLTISITGRNHSTLAKKTKLKIILPECNEICHLNLAPTTSTTLTLIVGDIIASLVSEKKEFSKHNFLSFHPSGKLGYDLQSVRKIMHKKMPLITKDTLMKEVIICMTKYGFGCAGVINDQQKLIGIITDGDLRRHIDDDFLNKSAVEVMTRSPKTLFDSETVKSTFDVMHTNKITQIFIVDKDQIPIGIVHIHHCHI